MLRSVGSYLVTDVLGQPIGPIFKGQEVKEDETAWTLKVGLIGCPEVLVTNYQSMVHNITEGRRSYLHQNGSLKSCIEAT
jgi:hypothetical protein